jgi:hypothetical protein
LLAGGSIDEARVILPYFNKEKGKRVSKIVYRAEPLEDNDEIAISRPRKKSQDTETIALPKTRSNGKRDLPATLIAAYFAISGVLGIILILVSTSMMMHLGGGPLLFLIVMILLSVVEIVAAYGTWTRQSWARQIVDFVSQASILLGLLITLNKTTEEVVVGLITIAISGAIAWYIRTPLSVDWFGKPKATSPAMAFLSGMSPRQVSVAPEQTGNGANQIIIIQKGGTPGLVPGVIGCILAILGIFTFGFIFVPLAAITTAIAALQASHHASFGGIAISVLSGFLTLVGFLTSPSLLALFGAASFAK